MNAAVDMGTSALSIIEASPVAVLTDAERFNTLYEAIEREAAATVPDTSTDAGRKAIASLAYKIARTKTAIDEAGKELNAAAREGINKVDAARRNIRERLDALKDKVRLPLTEWEAAEAARVQRVSNTIEMMTDAGALAYGDTSAAVAERLATIQAIEITEAEFGELMLAGVAARDSAIAALTAAKDRLARDEAAAAQAEADRVELAALRAAQTERDEAARVAREATEQAERDRLAAEQLRQAQAVAAERATAEAAAKAERERIATEQRHQAELLRVQRDAEAAAQAGRDRIAAEAAKAEREAAAAKAEEERKATNKRHQSAVMKAAKEALMTNAELTEFSANLVVQAIVNGLIPAVSLKF